MHHACWWRGEVNRRTRINFAFTLLLTFLVVFTRSGSKVFGSLYAFLERTKRTTHLRFMPGGAGYRLARPPAPRGLCANRGCVSAVYALSTLSPDDVGSLACSSPSPLHSTQMSWQDTVSGLAGSVCCTGLGLPFDVAKARIQNAPGVYSGLIDCMAKSVRVEGPLSLYSGALPALGSACTENAVGMTVNRGMRRQVAAWQGQSLAEVHISPPMEVALGGVTGVFTSVAICPFEVLKVQQQVVLAEGGAAPSMMHLLSQLVCHGGLNPEPAP